MKQHPILFSTQMVQAILAGRKTETRTTGGLKEINKEPNKWHFVHLSIGNNNRLFAHFQKGEQWMAVPCQYGQPGDVLWVREEHKITFRNDGHFITICYKDEHSEYFRTLKCKELSLNLLMRLKKRKTLGKWQRARFLPKAAARIWLQVAEIKVERLQDITEDSAIAEGVEVVYKHAVFNIYRDYSRNCKNGDGLTQAKLSFMTLWESINGPESWNANPWVWVVQYKVLSTTGKPQFINQ